MKKLLMLCSTVLSLFASAVSAEYIFHPCVNQHPCEHACVNRCDAVCVPATSCWDGQVYAGAFGGANWLKFNHSHGVKPRMKVGYVGALSLGYKFNNGIRVEAEVAYRRNRIHNKTSFNDYACEKIKITGPVSSWTYMANVLYDFDCIAHHTFNVVPYVGVGVGYTNMHAHLKAHNEIENVSVKAKRDGIAGQAIAGLSYRLTDATSVGVEYRYLVAKDHVRDHSVGLSLRQSF